MQPLQQIICGQHGLRVFDWSLLNSANQVLTRIDRFELTKINGYCHWMTPLSGIGFEQAFPCPACDSLCASTYAPLRHPSEALACLKSESSGASKDSCLCPVKV